MDESLLKQYETELSAERRAWQALNAGNLPPAERAALQALWLAASNRVKQLAEKLYPPPKI
jgi:hypothetical protein